MSVKKLKQILSTGLSLALVATSAPMSVGAIGPVEMEQAVHAVALALKDLGVASGKPGEPR